LPDRFEHKLETGASRSLRHQQALVQREIRRLARGHESGTERHDLAIIDAEARRLAHIVSSYGGVLTDRRLFELSGARHWRSGAFSLALSRARDSGLVRDLGVGFYASPVERPGR
jgi:hypothetical protein